MDITDEEVAELLVVAFRTRSIIMSAALEAMRERRDLTQSQLLGVITGVALSAKALDGLGVQSNLPADFLKGLVTRVEGVMDNLTERAKES